jgi:hypothetical protein
MKKSTFLGFVIVVLSYNNYAQTTADFENFSLSTGSYLDGSQQPLGTTFNSGNAIFTNFFDTSFGGFWSGGFAISAVEDSTTSGFMNLFGSKALKGNNGSNTYAVGQNGAIVKFNAQASGKLLNQISVCNTTYAYNSMKNGDAFAKKFGGISGNDPDFFLLSIKGYFNGNLINDSVSFYLADYRFADNSQDYIVKDWQIIDLRSLDNVDSLLFQLYSSDNSSFGMNTPAFFCVDDLVTVNSASSINENQVNYMHVFPNPTKNDLFVESNFPIHTIYIVNIEGRRIKELNLNGLKFDKLTLNEFSNGIYFIEAIGEKSRKHLKFIKW